MTECPNCHSDDGLREDAGEIYCKWCKWPFGHIPLGGTKHYEWWK